jgi:hypothetical protein
MKVKRDIVVFERDERYTGDQPELDFRLIRSILPVGSIPLAIADHDEFLVHSGVNFTSDEVGRFAEEQSGYRSINWDES